MWLLALAFTACSGKEPGFTLTLISHICLPDDSDGRPCNWKRTKADFLIVFIVLSQVQSEPDDVPGVRLDSIYKQNET